MESLGLPEKKLKQLKRKKIESVKDLYRFFPRDYIDYTKETGLREGHVLLFLLIIHVTSGVSKNNVPYIIATGLYEGKEVSVMWFRQKYLLSSIMQTEGEFVYVGGLLRTWQDSYSITAPDIYAGTPCVYPVYSKIPGMSYDYLRGILDSAFSIHPYPEVPAMSYKAEKDFGLIPYEQALYQMHFPKSMEEVHAAKKRLLYDDLFFFALHMARKEKRKRVDSFVRIEKSDAYEALRKSLPFALTCDQEKTIDDIVEHLECQCRVNALIQGDVGCGKTIVATLAMCLVSENGYQSVLLAPTSVLASQHFADISEMLPDVLYVPPLSSLRKKEKEEILRKISSGEAKVLIGTHALLSDEITFHNLGLLITDEEHKFGVEQREKLLQNASDGVHYITMSATPIPRSLAGIVYGESMELYLIETMPEGREPVQTAINHNFNHCVDFMYSQIDAGRQIYVVCPMIDANEKMEGVESVEELREKYTAAFGEERVGVLTGRNSKKETAEILSAFSKGEISILIATTVIEVGVNVPNANTIVIHNAERFGLAGLHQLRGRVGRGGGSAYCILYSEEKENKRLLAMCRTNNGFEIAEADLAIRGAGEILGTDQSGFGRYTSKVIAYHKIYEKIFDYIKKYLAF